MTGTVGIGKIMNEFSPFLASSSSFSMDVNHYKPLLALTVSSQSSPKYLEEIPVGTIPIKLVPPPRPPTTHPTYHRTGSHQPRPITRTILPHS
jgi:hypothetical protein